MSAGTVVYPKCLVAECPVVKTSKAGCVPSAIAVICGNGAGMSIVLCLNARPYTVKVVV